VSLPQEIISGFTFEKDNPTWKAILMLLDASIEAEAADALSKDNKGEDRAWHSGRTASLISFKDIIINTRNEVLADIGKPPEQYDSGKIG